MQQYSRRSNEPGSFAACSSRTRSCPELESAKRASRFLTAESSTTVLRRGRKPNEARRDAEAVADAAEVSLERELQLLVEA
jgi:hypothetical protein